MKKKYIAILAIIGVLLVLTMFAYSSMMSQVEHFTIEGNPDCVVYHGDEVEACDFGKTENGVEINYTYHKSHYEKQRDSLQAVAASNGSLTPEQSAKLVTLNKVISNYDRFPDGQSCKTTIPNWKQYSGGQEGSVKLGELPINQERGAPPQWAFCVKSDPNTSITDNEGNGLTLEKIDINGTKYLRGAFPNFDASTLKNLYCKERVAPEPPSFTGLIIDPATNQVTYMYQNMVLTEINTAALAALITKGVCEEMTREANGNEELYLIAKPISLPLVRKLRNMCDEDRIEQSASSVQLTVQLTIAPIKTIALNNNSIKHRLGTSAQLQSQRQDIMNLRSPLQAQLDKLSYGFYTRRNHKAYLESRVRSLNKQIGKINKHIQRSQEAKKRLGRAAGPLARKITNLIMNRVIKSFSSQLTSTIRKLENVRTDFNTINDCNQPGKYLAGLFSFYGRSSKSKSRKNNFISYCNHVKKHMFDLESICNSTSNDCPNNLPLAQKMHDVVKPLEDQIALYDEQIRAIDQDLISINAAKQLAIKYSLSSGQIMLYNPPYHSLSYDKKFYIPL